MGRTSIKCHNNSSCITIFFSSLHHFFLSSAHNAKSSALMNPFSCDTMGQFVSLYPCNYRAFSTDLFGGSFSPLMVIFSHFSPVLVKYLISESMRHNLRILRIPLCLALPPSVLKQYLLQYPIKVERFVVLSVE